MQLGISSTACNLPHKQRFMACQHSEIILFSPMKAIANVIVEPLAHCINLSLFTGTVPKMTKIA